MSTMTRTDVAMSIYRAYPRKVARGAALKAISKALQTVSFEELLEAVEAYCRSRVDENGQFRDDRKYTPHPSTWFNQQRWADDREEWAVTIQINSADAFEKLRLAIRKYGLMGRVDAAEVLDPIIMEAAVRIGWQRMCEMTEFNRDSLFRLFDSSLKAVARGEG
jgi:hypothetical protein